MKEHEADILKVLAALTAAPRWVSALVIADGGQFTWGHLPAWSIASAVLSVLFAAVETYAAAYVMRAWRRARPGSPQERALLTLWLSTLFCLVFVMAPPIYANTRQLEFATLPAPVLLVWSACVAMSTFLVLGGVGYAEREAVARPVAPVALAIVSNAPATPTQDGRNKAQLVTQYATDHPDATQADIARALQVNPATVSRAMRKSGND